MVQVSTPARKIILVLVGLVVTGLALFIGVNRVMYGNWSLGGPPDRIDYCGRRYYTRYLTLTESEVKTQGTSYSGQVSYQKVGTDGWGHPYFAWVLSEEPKPSSHSAVCTFGVYVKVGNDRYVSYGLSGGP